MMLSTTVKVHGTIAYSDDGCTEKKCAAGRHSLSDRVMLAVIEAAPVQKILMDRHGETSVA